MSRFGRGRLLPALLAVALMPASAGAARHVECDTSLTLSVNGSGVGKNVSNDPGTWIFPDVSKSTYDLGLTVEGGNGQYYFWQLTSSLPPGATGSFPAPQNGLQVAGGPVQSVQGVVQLPAGATSEKLSFGLNVFDWPNYNGQNAAGGGGLTCGVGASGTVELDTYDLSRLKTPMFLVLVQLDKAVTARKAGARKQVESDVGHARTAVATAAALLPPPDFFPAASRPATLIGELESDLGTIRVDLAGPNAFKDLESPTLPAVEKQIPTLLKELDQVM